MKTFLIQNLDYDFCWNLVQAIKYQNWYYGEDKFQYIIIGDCYNEDYYYKLYKEDILKGDFIPVGSLEFVFGFLDYTPKPINIPEELRKSEFLKRLYFIVKNKDDLIYELNMDKKEPLFIKSATEYKKFADMVYIDGLDNIADDEYWISNVVDIQSEWRSFIFNGKLIGLNNYAGDFTKFPDVELIKDMIDKYKNCPRSYTLDVGVNNKGTFVLEVHPMVSCGLYGFSDYKILPQMIILGWNYMVENIKR